MRKYGIKVIAVLLISSQVFFAAPERAYATVVTTDPGNTFTNIYGNIISTISQGYEYISSYLADQMYMKEFVWDGLTDAAMGYAREALVRSVIDWAGNGFEGSPAFVQNFEGYLRGKGDQIATDFIVGTGLDALCEPFALNIRSALALKYGQDMRTHRIDSCSFNDIEKNINNLGKNVEKSFSSKDFFTYTSKSTNSPQGAYLNAKTKLSVSIDDKEYELTKELDFGKGFLSKKECTEIEGREVCKTITPGDTISASINKSLGLGADALVNADEINEFVGAFIGYLLRSTLQDGLTNAGRNENNEQIGYGPPDQEPPNTTQAREVLDRLIGEQQYAISSFNHALTMIENQCSSAQTTEARLEDYRRRNVYNLYLELSGREARANDKLREMQELRNKKITTTQESISYTNQVSALTQDPDVYMNSPDFDKLISSYVNTINERCPA